MPDGVDMGPHLFHARIQFRDELTGQMTALPGVHIDSLGKKITLNSLDNAFMSFADFKVDRAELLSRFSWITESGNYHKALPEGNYRMLDLLIARLITGRICLSEYSLAKARVNHFFRCIDLNCFIRYSRRF